MTASIKAARACAATLLFHSLRLHAFRGGLPHVLVVVDRVPCVQQKVVVEGYLQVLGDYQRRGAAYLEADPDSAAHLPRCEPPTPESASHDGVLAISLKAGSETPCGSAGFSSDAEADWQNSTSAGVATPAPLSYSLMPFHSESFLDVIKRLQRFFRHCGDGRRSSSVPLHASAAASASLAVPTPKSEATATAPVWTAETFAAEFEALCPLLGPLLSLPLPGETQVGEAAALRTDAHGDAAVQQRCLALFHGPSRELLGCILVQRNAFQNEMKRYRLRLSLFDLGIRVAEHCHLQIMSQEADRLASEGRFSEALADDEVFSYARSCAFRPEQAQCLAKAIADAIDVYSWQREALDAGASAGTTPPPAAFTAALCDPALQAIFNPGALRWGNAAFDLATPHELSTSTHHDVEAVLRQTIRGPGVPLSIVSRDPAKVLTYRGGMEDCLTNTGYYVAAYAPERNDVAQHRARFRVDDDASVEAALASATELSEADSSATAASATAAAGTVHGRLKKKDYLAMLRSKGQKPNKPQQNSDEDEDGALGRSSAPAGSCISNSIGGTFPIGEVISESFDLSQLDGTCDVFAYPDVFKHVTMSQPAPFTMTIERGIVTQISDGAPIEFLDLLSLVRQVEGDCYVRELGIGLNPYVGRAHVVSDVTTFERQWGIHLSLGQRHPLFVKQRARCNADGSVAPDVRVEGPVLKRKAGKYHIDVFIDAAELRMGNVFSVDFTKGIAIP